MADENHTITVNEANFEQAVLVASQTTPVLVDFWAEWCAPCRNLTPVLTKLAEEYGGAFVLAKVNSDENQRLATQAGIRSLPTVLLFVKGQIVDGFVGVQPESAVRALLDQHVTPAAEPEAEPAPVELSVDDRVAAIAELRGQLESTPDDEETLLMLARLLVDGAEFDEAEQLLLRLPADKQVGAEATELGARIRVGRFGGTAEDEAALRQRIAADPQDSEAALRLGATLALLGRYDDALEILLALVMRDRAYGEDAARKTMVDVFTLMGGGPVVKEFRSRLYSALN
jgi:putative thioredoxin